MSLWLTPKELVELTGYKYVRRQKEALERMGVQFLSRAQDGFPLVKRAQFDAPAQTTVSREPQLRLS